MNCTLLYKFECRNEVFESEFIDNFAGIQGGAINYDLAPPFIDQVEFDRNKVTFEYGADVASYPAYIDFLDPDSPWRETVSLQSGKQFNSAITMGLFDWNDNLVTTWPDSIYSISSSNGKVFFQGSTTYIFSRGTTEINKEDLIFLANEGVEDHIIISSDTIDIEVYARFKSDGQTRPALPVLDLVFGECTVGEAFQE